MKDKGRREREERVSGTGRERYKIKQICFCTERKKLIELEEGLKRIKLSK